MQCSGQVSCRSWAGVFLAVATALSVIAGPAPSEVPSPFQVTVNAEAPRLGSLPLQGRGNTQKWVVFNATLRVVNTSDEEMAFRVWSCSWSWNWKMQGRGVDWATGPCTRNALVPVVLKPGEAHEQKVLMYVKKGWSADTVAFKVAFSPTPRQGSVRLDDANPTYWGEEVVIKVPRKDNQ